MNNISTQNHGLMINRSYSDKNSSVFIAGGNINIASAQDLYKIMRRNASEGHKSVTVDLTQVKYIDSWGLSMLVNCQKFIKRRGGSLKLIVSPRLNEIFEIASLSLILDIAVEGESAD